MAAVAGVLVVAFTTICVIDYNQSVNDVRAALSVSINRGGPMRDFPADSGRPDMMMRRDGDMRDIGKQFEIGGKGDRDPFVPVAVFRVTSNGALQAVSGVNTASLTEEVLSQAASHISALPDGEGVIDSVGLFYAKRTFGDEVLVAFADKSSASGWQGLALVLFGVGAATLLVFFFISLAFSKWALRPVDESWRRQQQFVADASHELKTPLTVISANTSILMKNPDKTIASQSQWVESTADEVGTMRDLVEEMLLMASLDESQGKEVFAPVNLSKVVEGTLLQFESLAYENDVSVEDEIEEGITIDGVHSQLERMVGTLLDNAYKYAGRGGRVEVTLAREGQLAKLSVRNSGAPIPAEDLPHVFDRFYRADKVRTGGAGGYGLGLAIAYDIAQEHGGEMRVASSAEDGTVFVVTFSVVG